MNSTIESHRIASKTVAFGDTQGYREGGGLTHNANTGSSSYEVI